VGEIAVGRRLALLVGMMLGSIARGAFLTLAATAATLSHAPDADACSPVRTPSLYPELPGADLTEVPVEGVLAFHASGYGTLEEVVALASVAVTLDGIPVSGAVESLVVDSSGEGGIESHNLFVIWRPDATLVAGSTYAATIEIADAGGNVQLSEDLQLTTAAEPSADPPVIGLGGVALAAARVGAGPRVCCDTGNSCGFEECSPPAAEDRPQLSATVVGYPGPMGRQGYLRLVAGVDGTVAEYAALGLAADALAANIQRTFDEQGAEYCLGVEFVSLIDGAVTSDAPDCLSGADLVLGEGPNENFESFLGQCLGEPYWEDTDEPYEPDTGGTGTDGGSDSGGDDSDGTGGGTADGGDADGTAGEGDGTAGDEGGLDTDSRGCACDVNRSASPLPMALGLLVLGAGVLRRRRR
jgi:MYXO-CTERM domain-containing protein